MSAPAVEQLRECLDALARWQRDDGAFQLHPGDIGWHWRFGAARTAAATRVWRTDGDISAVALLDGPTLRLALAPELARDKGLAETIVVDALEADIASVEAPRGSVVRERLSDQGWVDGEVWTPLARDLGDAVEVPQLTASIIGPHDVDARVKVQRAAFENSTFTVSAWHEMAWGPAYASARCVVGHDDSGTPVAAATVWSAGVGRPGLIEPLGVHRDHRGNGFGTDITLAAARALRDLGASRAIVATPRSNAAGVATYLAAGFTRLGDIRDLERPA